MLAGNRLSATASSDPLTRVTPAARLQTALSSPPPYPMVLLPAEGGFWSDPPPIDQEMQEFINPTIEANQHYYNNFRGMDHNNYCCMDPILGPVVLSIKYNQDPQEACQAEVVSRTSSGSRHQLVDLSDDKENNNTAKQEDSLHLKDWDHDGVSPAHLEQIGEAAVPGLDVSKLVRLVENGVVDKLLEFDDYSDTNVKSIKFGLIYQKVGQTTEEEMFDNKEHSEAMDTFMEMLGTKVDLSQHKGYLGGLQSVDGLTGESSLYTQHKDKEFMFHVSTFLPHSNVDPHQIQKKRHIGNDIMSLVFQDGDTPFSPDMIQSQFLNAYIVIRPVGDQEYQVCVTAKNTVNQFGPILPKEATFARGPEFREWLLNKLVSGRKSCYKSERFTKIFLASLVQQLMAEEMKQKIGQQTSAKTKPRTPLGDCWPTCCGWRGSGDSIYKKFI